jgi:hypothetical protein
MASRTNVDFKIENILKMKPTIAIFISGFLRTWEYTRQSFEKIFCKDIQPDLYLHVYRENLHEWSAGVEDKVYTVKDIEKMFSGLNVKEIVIEDLNSARKTVCEESDVYKFAQNFSNPINESSDSKTETTLLGRRIYDQFRVINLSGNLIKTQYDILVKTRYDVLYLSSPNWSEILDGKLHTETGACGGYPHDVVLAGTPDVMQKIVISRLEQLPLLFLSSPVKGGSCACGNILPCCLFCAHATLRHLLDYHKIQLGSHLCKAVVARSKNSIHVPGIGTTINKFCTP